MTSNRPSLKVAIIGAGITGLAAAYEIETRAQEAQLDVDYKVFESTERAGGAIRTEKNGDRIIEHGPDSMLSSKPEALDLINKLGLGSELISTNEENRRSLVASNGKLHALPEGFVMLAPTKMIPFLQTPLFSIGGKLRMALDLVSPPRLSNEDETVESFALRRFGREALERVVQPMVGGIYVGDVSKLSALATLPQFVEMERRQGSVIRGMMARSRNTGEGTAAGARYSMFVSLKGGVQSLVNALESHIGAQRLAKSTAVCKIEKLASGCWKLETDSGNHEFDAVIFATPAHVTARIVDSVDRDLAGKLSSIEAASAVVVNLLYSRAHIPHLLNGFGFVVPPSEKRSILAASFISNKFPDRAPSGSVQVRAFLGGVLQSELVELSDEKLIELVRRDLEYYLGVNSQPLTQHLSRFPASMPQYNLGHSACVQDLMNGLAQRMPGVYLAGNSYQGVGIPDCIRSANRAAGAAIEYARRRSNVESVTS